MRPNQKRNEQHGQALAADWQKILEAVDDITAEVESVAGELTEDAINTVTTYTTRHPKHAILAAALIGFAVGCWIKRK